MKICYKIVLILLVTSFFISVLPTNVYAGKVIETNGVTITKVSNPDAGEREVDGLVEGGDRKNSYTWRLAERGDYIYIATTRNIGSAIINMYGSLALAMGLSENEMWAIVDTVTNGEIPRSDENNGANIISYNKITGEFKVIYTAEDYTYFRMAVTFGDNVYFGSYSANPSVEQYILKLDTEGNFTKVFTTQGSVSLRANCVYDDHLYFAGADEREVVANGDGYPTKMAVLQKSNEDDTVWERVADYKDFGEYAYDAIMSSWAGAPIWELSSYKGYIYATAPSTAGFVMFKGHPAIEGEEANEYGWYWEEVVGNNNGINEPGLSSVEGGEPGTMRSLIGSTFVFNDELYVYNFDHGFGGELYGFIGMVSQLFGSEIEASDFFVYMYESLQNPQHIWKLNDETGEFEECTGFTELMEGTTNEYVWRAGEYDGQMYLATFDAATLYNYFTRLTNGTLGKMSEEELEEQIDYIVNLLKLIAESDIEEEMDLGEYEGAVLYIKEMCKNIDSEAIKDYLREFIGDNDNLDEAIDSFIRGIDEEEIEEFVDTYIDEDVINGLIDNYITEENVERIIDRISGDYDLDEIISEYIDEDKKDEIISKVKEKLGYEEEDELELSYAVKELLVSYLKDLVEDNIDTVKETIVNVVKGFLDKYAESEVSLADLEDAFASFVVAMEDADIEELVDEYLDEESINNLIDQLITEENIESILDSISEKFELEEIISEYFDEEEQEEIINKILEKLGYEEDEENPSSFAFAVKEILVSYLKDAVETYLDPVKEKIIEVYDKIDWEGIEMYLYISSMVRDDNWGFDLIRTADGENFELLTDDGFGDKYNYGASSFLATDEGLYIGTCNPFYGGQLYLLTTGIEGSHKVTFELDDGEFPESFVNPVRVLDGECVEKPSNPTKKGYSFIDWYADEGLTTKFNFDKPIEEDTTIYARWRNKASSNVSSSSSKSKATTNNIQKVETKPQETEIKPQEDVTWSESSEWAVEELANANKKGLIPSTFNKKDFTKPITRKDFAAVAVKLYEAITKTQIVPVAINPFVDTADEYVLKAYTVGITVGTSETTFSPDLLITREEMATMLTRGLSKAGISINIDLNDVDRFVDDYEMHDWGKEAVYYMANQGIIKGIGDDKFDALGNATIEQSLAIALRSVNAFEK